MNPEGVSRIWARAMMNDGPFPAHYEPFESPVTNPVFPKVKGNPVSRVLGGDWTVFGEAGDFPIVATTYRITEHFHYWTNVQINAVLQPEFFVEMSEELAQEKGIRLGSRCGSGRTAARSRRWRW
jgi:formate dehydrogenase major subunit